jgi:KH/beta-lactamase-domain protein
MLTEDALSDIRHTIIQGLPTSAMVSSVEFEGPEIAVYSKNPKVLLEDGGFVKELAKKLRKRIVLRFDPNVRTKNEEAEKKIREIVPPEAEITKIYFDENIGEVVIEAKKPGLVIGRNGNTLGEITRLTYWRPSVVRTPPLESRTVMQISNIMQKESEKRKQILREVGQRIYRIPALKNEWVRVTALGGFREVGRTAILVQTQESSVLVDCGVNVGSTEHAFPKLSVNEFDIDGLDAVIITHAHIDHSGFLPFLYKYGYRGPVYCTRATKNLMTLLQLDYLEVAEKEGKLLPYGPKDVRETVLHTIPLDYGEVTDISPDIRLTLHNAGHILGSAMAHLHIGDGLYNMAYTGDFKYARTRLLEPANANFPRLETLIMESTYGGQNDMMSPRNRTEEQLARIIKETISRRGRVLVPVLAVGRAQELMLVLEELVRRKIIDEVPIYIDGMTSEATAIHTTHPELLAQDLRERIFHQGRNPFLAEYFVKVQSNEVRTDIVAGEPCIIIATSGMLTGGPSVEYFRLMAGDERNCMIFVSYQVEGTLGRRVQKGWHEIPMQLRDGRTEIVKVNMRVETVEGFSGHSDRKQLLSYVRQVTPRPERIILCHGESSKCLNLAAAIHSQFRIETRVPQNLETTRIK